MKSRDQNHIAFQKVIEVTSIDSGFKL